MFIESQLIKIELELKKNWQQLNYLIQDISKQIGVAPRFNVPIESSNVGFFFGADYV
jgi:hypothetical protein